MLQQRGGKGEKKLFVKKIENEKEEGGGGTEEKNKQKTLPWLQFLMPSENVKSKSIRRESKTKKSLQKIK